MLKNMKIGKKLILTFALVVIITSIAGIVGLMQMTNLNTNYTYALNNYGFSQGDVGNLHAEFNALRSTTKDLILYTDSKGIQETSDKIDKEDILVNQFLVTMQKTMVNEKEIDIYTDIKDSLAKYNEAQRKVIALAKENKNTEAFALFKSEASPLADKVEANLDALSELKTATGNQLASSLTSQKSAADLTVYAVILISILLSILIAVSIARSISKPVKEMAVAAERMSKGDLGVQININSKDEIGQLGTAFAQSTASIRSYIADITKVLGEIQDGNLTVDSELDYIGDYTELKNAYQGILVSLMIHSVRLIRLPNRFQAALSKYLTVRRHWHRALRNRQVPLKNFLHQSTKSPQT